MIYILATTILVSLAPHNTVTKQSRPLHNFSTNLCHKEIMETQALQTHSAMTASNSWIFLLLAGFAIAALMSLLVMKMRRPKAQSAMMSDEDYLYELMGSRSDEALDSQLRKVGLP